MSESEPISWRSIVYGTTVISSDDQPVGTVHEVLGSDSEDIFHGIRLALTGRRDVFVSVDDVGSMSADRIGVDLTRAEVEALPTYDEHAAYHLASVGRLRKHIDWKRDSKSGEGPG